MNDVSPRSLWPVVADKPRAPLTDWKKTGQPLGGLRVTDYIEMAEEAAPALERKLVSLCGEINQSCVIIPHADFQHGFEHGPDKFRPWFNRYCADNGLNADAQIMIITGVKDLQSADRKSQFNTEQIDMHKDYARGMVVKLRQPGIKPSQKLAALDGIIQAVVAREETRAVNDLFAKPKEETGCRAFKVAWSISCMGDLETLASIKIQHEDQMDIDKLTRRFMGYQREVVRAQPKWWDCTSIFNSYSDSERSRDEKRTHKHARQYDGQSKALAALGIALYDDVYARNGYNEWLLPDEQAKHVPLSAAQLRDKIQQTVQLCAAGQAAKIAMHIVESGVLPPQLATLRALQLHHH